MKQTDERRRARRQMCSQLIEVAFQDQAGRWIRETGVVEDIGPNGFAISLSVPVTSGREVTVATPEFQGKATVKHCRYEDYSYLVGLEFGEGFEWDGQSWRPEHLLSTPED